MKYIITVLVISSILAISAYVFKLANNKTDKIFILIVVVLLVLTGLFFSIKGEIYKKKESKAQAESLSITKQNTEDLKEKSEVIITNINENLEKLIVINDSVSNLNSALSDVEKDLAEQLKVFNNTLTQTKVFEQKVSEQLKLEKKRLEMERPEVEVVASLEKKQGNQYIVLFEYRNLGKRIAKDFNGNAIVGISNDKKNLSNHFKMESSTEDGGFDITPIHSGGVTIKMRSNQIIDATGIEDDLRLVVLLKYTYKDEYLNEVFEKENYFFWYGFNKTGMLLVSANNEEFTERLNDYIKKNNLEF